MLTIAWSPAYHHPLPQNHRFPMEKYSLLPQQLLYEGTVTQQNFFEPQPASESQILAVHHANYWQKLQQLSLSKQEIRRTGFPLSNALVKREVLIAGGTVSNAFRALDHGCSFNIAGGTHHAYADRGEGFCLLNDIAIAATALLQRSSINQILIVDLDVHQGNGTAKIFEHHSAVYTFSMHGQNNYPLHKEQSNKDVPLPDGISDKDYLKLLDYHLKSTLDEVAPDFIFFLAGVDVLASDKLGRLGLTHAGCKARDALVFETCYKNQVPIAVSMGGGYSPKISEIIEAHANTYRVAAHYYD
ncbi:MAG: histone deacetylase [Schleiferiaceae bacterium]|nr:histone deacetylase [Schleiferiaceae bacterium]